MKIDKTKQKQTTEIRKVRNFFFFGDRVFLHNPGCPGTRSIQSMLGLNAEIHLPQPSERWHQRCEPLLPGNKTKQLNKTNQKHFITYLFICILLIKGLAVYSRLNSRLFFLSWPPEYWKHEYVPPCLAIILSIPKAKILLFVHTILRQELLTTYIPLKLQFQTSFGSFQCNYRVNKYIQEKFQAGYNFIH